MGGDDEDSELTLRDGADDEDHAAAGSHCRSCGGALLDGDPDAAEVGRRFDDNGALLLNEEEEAAMLDKRGGGNAGAALRKCGNSETIS